MPGDAFLFMHGLEVLGEIKGLEGALSLRLQVFLEGSAKCIDGWHHFGRGLGVDDEITKMRLGQRDGTGLRHLLYMCLI